MKNKLSPNTINALFQLQKDEITGSLLYKYIARRQKDPYNKNIFEEFAQVEYKHYETWKSYTETDVAPNYLKIFTFKVLSFLLGVTFTVKYLEKSEYTGIKNLNTIASEIPYAKEMVKDEQTHEYALISMLDEERLQYVGSMVLGLNDALVELSGAIAGFTFALANTRLIALSAIITGVSATLSMAASSYLAERAEGNNKALKSSIYTGITYLITVVLMITPYLLLPNDQYVTALGIMLLVVISIILFFSYYLSVTKSLPFLSRFLEMALISLGVSAISFAIGLVAKSLLGIDI